MDSYSTDRYLQTILCDAVAPGASCTASITYYPCNAGSANATFTVTSNAPNSPHVVSLTANKRLVAAD
jgi:hypothetical protein